MEKYFLYNRQSCIEANSPRETGNPARFLRQLPSLTRSTASSLACFAATAAVLCGFATIYIPLVENTVASPKESKVEAVKRHSRGLRGDIAAGLLDAEPHFPAPDQQLLKFHGTY